MHAYWLARIQSKSTGGEVGAAPHHTRGHAFAAQKVIAALTHWADAYIERVFQHAPSLFMNAHACCGRAYCTRHCLAAVSNLLHRWFTGELWRHTVSCTIHALSYIFLFALVVTAGGVPAPAGRLHVEHL